MLFCSAPAAHHFAKYSLSLMLEINFLFSHGVIFYKRDNSQFFLRFRSRPTSFTYTVNYVHFYISFLFLPRNYKYLQHNGMF